MKYHLPPAFTTKNELEELSKPDAKKWIKNKDFYKGFGKTILRGAAIGGLVGLIGAGFVSNEIRDSFEELGQAYLNKTLEINYLQMVNLSAQVGILIDNA